MGCSASVSLPCLSSSTIESGQDTIYSTDSTDQYYEQARAVLATIPAKAPIQRRRARSVGMPSSGEWVYWRPEWNDRTQQQRTQPGTIPTSLRRDKIDRYKTKPNAVNYAQGRIECLLLRFLRMCL